MIDKTGNLSEIRLVVHSWMSAKQDLISRFQLSQHPLLQPGQIVPPRQMEFIKAHQAHERRMFAAWNPADPGELMDEVTFLADKEKGEAFARLIAFAPEEMEALRELLFGIHSSAHTYFRGME